MLIYNLKRLMLRVARGNGILDILKCTYFEFRNHYLYPIFKKTWSPNGEDLYVASLLSDVSDGFYVDVGAHTPKVGSNTYKLYLQGWTGITIDPIASCIADHKKHRPKDLSLNIGVGDKDSEMTFYNMFPESLCTFSKEEVDRNIKKGFKLVSTTQIEVKTLENVLNKYAKGKKVNFLNVDTEGLDYLVLKSNNWSKYKPSVICVEVQESAEDKKIKDLLTENGYVLNKELGNNFIFVLEDDGF